MLSVFLGEAQSVPFDPVLGYSAESALMFYELIEPIQSAISGLGPWFGGVAVGIILALVTNRRKIVTYTVSHDRIGITTEDNVLGSVAVTVEGTYNASNLYLSKVIVNNRSLKDIENLNLTIFVNSENCNLLTETAFIHGSVSPVEYSDEYKDKVESRPTDDEAEASERSAEWRARREYKLPAFNRGATMELTYLVDVAHGADPGIFLDSNALGVRIKYKQEPFVATHVWGIPVRHAAYAGVLFWLVIILPILLLYTPIGGVHILVAGVSGIFFAIPGALTLKAYNYFRTIVSG